MSKFFAITLIGLLYTFLGYSQRASLLFGEEDKTKLSTEYYLAKGKGTDMIKLSLVAQKHGIGGFAKYSKLPKLGIYNKRMELTKEKELPELDVNTTFDKLLAMGDKLFLFTNQYEKASKSTSFFCQAFDSESLEPEGSNMLLGKFEMSKLTNGEEFRANANHFNLIPGGKSNFDQQVANYYFSSDSSKLLMAISAPRAVQENEQYYIAVYDNDMTKMWERTVELPFQSKFIDLQSMAVTNKGEVCAVIKKYQTEKIKEGIKQESGEVPDYTTQLLVFKQDNPVHASYPLDLNGKFVHSLELTDSKNGMPSIFGLYQQEPDGNCQGFFTTTINLAGKEPPNVILTAFSDELVSQITKEKQGYKKGVAGISIEYRIAKVIARNNGTTDYVLEFYSFTWFKTSPHNMIGNSIRTVYAYGNLIDININDLSGKSIVTKIPRLQLFPGIDIGGGFQAFAHNDMLLLIFNDHEDNVDKKSNESPKHLSTVPVPTTIALQLAVVDSFGGVKRSLVLNPEEKRQVDIKNGVFLNKNIIAILSLGGFFGYKGKILPGILTIK